MINGNRDILIVEDSPTQAQRLKSLLVTRFPAEHIRLAKNGKDALDRVAEKVPALIISDVVMPVMDGYQMCSVLKKNPACKTIPVILLTSLSDPEDIIRGLNAGTDYYLTKPYEDNFLISRISEILEHPLGPEFNGDTGWKVTFAGRDHIVHADLQQMLNLLLSTYDNAVQQNRKLITVQEELRSANESLEERVRQRTRELVRSNEQLQVEILERMAAENSLQLQLKRLDALRQIDTAISGSLDLRVTLNVLLDQVISQLNVDAADVLLLKHSSTRLSYAAGRGFRARLGGNGHFDYSKGPAGQVVRDRMLLRIENLENVETLPFPEEVRVQEEFMAYVAVPLLAKGRAEGVLEVFSRQPLSPNEQWLDFLEALAAQAAIAIDSALLFDDLQHSNAELFNAYETTLEGWSKALDLRDKETEGHSLRVTEMTEVLSRRLGISEEEIVHIRRGALLHDIGKLGIPDNILRKEGPLTVEEREIMCRHPFYAFEMLSPIHFLRQAIDIPYCHHEKWDGTGYPRGLKEKQIPLAARIFAVADVWDALRSTRPYRASCSRAYCLQYVVKNANTHFDPGVVAAFVEWYEKLEGVVDPLPENDGELER